jgi:nicotinamide-nucleotide amidase
MRCEVVAVGTELLLGQIVDTNGAWMGEQLALAGIDVLHRQTVGDNLDRIVEAIRLAPRLDELDALAAASDAPAPTLAFLASGIEGLKVRVTVKADDDAAADRLLDAEEQVLRGILGDMVFGVDDENMEHAVAKLLVAQGRTLAVAESLTGGLVTARLVDVPGASAWLRGGVVTYASDLKHLLLDVPEGPVVSDEAAAAMAAGVRRVMGADVGLGVTGVAGPDMQEGQRPGTVFLGVAVGEDEPITVHVRLPGDRDRVRQFACISLLDLLRRTLSSTAPLERIL